MSPRSRAALLLLLVTTFTAGCTGAMGSGLRPSATTTTTIIGWESRFRLDWTVQARAGGNDIEGYMYSQHGTPVTHVRLLAQGLDATGNVVSQKIEWLGADLPGLQRVYFRIPGMSPAPQYRVSVWQFDPIESKSKM